MKSWRIGLLALTLLPACAGDALEPQTRSEERPVRVSDAEAAKALGSAKPAEPRLHDPSVNRDPSLFVDLDAFIKSEKQAKPSIAPNAAGTKPHAPTDSAVNEGRAGEAARR